MKSKSTIVILCTSALLTLTACTPVKTTSTFPVTSSSTNNVMTDHNYFVELPEFTIRVTDDPNNTQPIAANTYPSSIEARYVKQTIVTDKRESNTSQKMAYLFELLDAATQVYLLIPPGIADNINLIPNEVYQITNEIQYGWPNAYGLIIKQSDQLVFAGISAWIDTKVITINTMLPFQVTQSRILEDNYIAGGIDDFFVRKTNTEILFTLNGESMALHQGQSSTLAGYEIKLLIARDIQYKQGWYDYGQVGISYVISKTE